MSVLFRLGFPKGVRHIHTSARLLKDEKSKQLLKNLGLSLQKGNIKADEPDSHGPTQDPPQSQETEDKKAEIETKSTTNTTNDDSTTSQPDSSASSTVSAASQQYQDSLNRLNNAYDTISHMTTDDLLIQENLDQGRQLFSHNPHHYVNRKEIIRSLPDELDLFNPDELKRIDEFYDKLAILDSDKSVQFKYYKRYLKKYADPVSVMIQEFNGVTKKFRLLRRKEMESLSLAPGAYLYLENLFGSPYNVVGFDNSISGLPLRTGKHRLTEKCYPQEFIEDLQMFRSKIPIHKRDLDFVESEDSATNINPRKVLAFRPPPSHDEQQVGSGLGAGTLQTSEQINQFFNKIYSNLEAPRNSISIDSIDNYNSLDLNNEVVIRIENEILLMKKTLQHEIETFMKSSLNSRILMYNGQHLRHNQYRLCESKSSSSISSDSLLVINYNLKEFNLIPNYGLVLNTLKQRKNLRNHLYKIFLINLEDQIDTLFRIKYYNERDMNRFMKKIVKNIGHVIKFKLQKLFKPFQVASQGKRVATGETNPVEYDALIFSPYLNRSNCFKRIYWLNNRVRNFDDSVVKRPNVNRRGALTVNWKNFDNLIEY